MSFNSVACAGVAPAYGGESVIQHIQDSSRLSHVGANDKTSMLIKLHSKYSFQ